MLDHGCQPGLRLTFISKLDSKFFGIWCCEQSVPALNHLDYQNDGKRTPLRDRDCLGNDPQWVPSQYSGSLFQDVPGTATEQVRTCGFRGNSSSLDKAPKMRDSVPLNSFEFFLVPLPSISSENWEMYSWAISGSSVFCDWVSLVFSGVSLETAANFRWFFKVAMILREKFCQLWRLNWSFIFFFFTKCLTPLLWGKRVSTNANS